MTREDRILSHVGLVKKFVLSHRNWDVTERDDMIADGMIGLIYAVDHYDESRGTTFPSYAQTCILSAVRDGFRQRDHLSRHTRKLVQAGELTVTHCPVKPDSATVQPHDPTVRLDVRRAVGQLPPRERSLIRDIYWKDSKVVLPGVTRQMASLVHHRALRRLREPLKAYWRAGSAAEGRQTSLAATA